MKVLSIVICTAFVAALVPTTALAQLLGPGDPIIAIDLDTGIDSSYPGSESPGNLADQNTLTKYLNFGAEGTGFIVTPAFGASLVQSLRLTTANDAEERDPNSCDLYGTTDPITSGDNSLGDEENWTLIFSGALMLPSERLAPGGIHSFANSTPYTSYKMIFPTIKNPNIANSMQLADVSFFTGIGGSGSQILADMDPALAVSENAFFDSSYPGGESPANAIDGTLDKYLNFGGENSGFIVYRADGLPTTVESFRITTANDAPERDPAAWELYGTNDPVISPDNSTGEDEDWTLVDFGIVDLPLDRNAIGSEVLVENTTAWGAYRMVFTELRNPAVAGSMQIAEIAFVPEPATSLGLLLGVVFLSGCRRKRA